MSVYQRYSALIYGATGAVGKEIVRELLKSSKWSKIHVVVRKQLQEWSEHPNKSKLQIQVLKDMELLLKPQKFKYQKFDSLFCCFGSLTKYGQQTFVKVDKTYPLCAADIALKNNIPHYLLVSAIGTDENSWFLYPRTKGQTENQLKLKKMPLLSIFRPGLLLGRQDQRPMQKCGKYFPCLPKIHVNETARSMINVAERDMEKARKNNVKPEVQMYQNNQMLKLL